MSQGYRVCINPDFGELILKIADPTVRNTLLALAVKLDVLAEPIPSEAEVQAAGNVRALRRTVEPDEVVH